MAGRRRSRWPTAGMPCWIFGAVICLRRRWLTERLRFPRPSTCRARCRQRASSPGCWQSSPDWEQPPRPPACRGHACRRASSRALAQLAPPRGMQGRRRFHEREGNRGRAPAVRVWPAGDAGRGDRGYRRRSFSDCTTAMSAETAFFMSPPLIFPDRIVASPSMATFSFHVTG